MTFAIIIASIQYSKTKHKTFLYLALTWINISLMTLFEVLSYLFLSIILFQIHIYFIIFGGFFLILCIDSFSRFGIDPIKTMIFGILSTLLVILSIIPNSIGEYTFPNGDESLASQGPLVWCSIIISALIALLFLVYAIKIYLNSPLQIKKYARLNLIGAIISGLIPTIAMATRLTLVIPGCGYVAVSFGAIITTVAFALQPKLRDVLLEISRDIRVQTLKQLENRISEKEKQYQTLYAAMSEGVTVNTVLYNDKDEIVDFMIEDVNPAYESLFQTTSNKAIGLKGSEVYPKNYHFFLERYNIAKTKGKAQVFDLNFHTIKKLFFISLFTLSNEDQFANIFMDVTAERKREEERIKNDKIESIGNLAAEIAHDFNNLLTAVIGNIQLAQLLNTPNNEISNCLNDAEKAAFQGKDITNHFLTFAQGGSPIKKTIHIEKILRDGARISLKGSCVKSNFSISKDLWLVNCDGGQIQQAINNIIINAKEAMPDGGNIDISAVNEILVKDSVLLNSGNYVKITLKDYGIGIPHENIARIFDPFFSTKPRKEKQGMGLGLTTAYSIIKRHDGHLTVHSQVNVGTTVEIYLLVSEIPSKDQIIEKIPIVQGIGNILLMDDEEHVRNIVKSLLNHIGYNVETANSGEEAIEKYKQDFKSYNIVILDLIVHGGLGGLKTLEKLKKINPNIKSIVISGYSNDPILSNFQKYGFNGKIEKPFEIETMSKVISEILNDRRHSMKNQNK